MCFSKFLSELPLEVLILLGSIPLFTTQLICIRLMYIIFKLNEDFALNRYPAFNIRTEFRKRVLKDKVIILLSIITVPFFALLLHMTFN